MAQSHRLENGQHFNIVSDQALEKLHQKFMSRIASKAQRIVPQDTPAREEMIALAQDALLVLERLGQKKSLDILSEKIADGPKALKSYLRKLTAQLETDPWKKYRKEMNKAFARREEAILSAKTFADKERIYLKLTDASIKNIHSDVRSFVAHKLDQKGYQIKDYVKGYATDAAGKQTFKIGKLLKDAPLLLESFVTDEARTSTAKYIVFSRNQTDLENMTARRSWLSCMSPDTFGHAVPPIVGSKTLIAYLISENDPEINNPLSRILLKPYDCRENVEGIREPEGALTKIFKRAFMRKSYAEDLLEEDSVVFVAGYSYGLGTKVFKDAVQEFADTYLNKPNDKEYHRYDYIYADGAPTKVKARAGVVRDATWPNP